MAGLVPDGTMRARWLAALDELEDHERARDEVQWEIDRLDRAGKPSGLIEGMVNAMHILHTSVKDRGPRP
jgi:hypothetical protein